MPIERAVTKHPSVQISATKNSLRDGIVLCELQEQKCQQRMCQNWDVVHTCQVGWMVLSLQWKMAKFLVIVYRAAITEPKLLWKTVDLNSSTNFIPHLYVTHATVVQTDFGTNALHVIGGFINKSLTSELKRVLHFFIIIIWNTVDVF